MKLTHIITLSPVDQRRQYGQNAPHFRGNEQLDVHELKQQSQPLAIHRGQQMRIRVELVLSKIYNF